MKAALTVLENLSFWQRNMSQDQTSPADMIITPQEAAELLAEGNQFDYSLVTQEQFDRFLGPEGWSNFEPDRELSGT